MADFIVTDFSAGTYSDTADPDLEYDVTTGQLKLSFPYAIKDGNLISYWRFSDNSDPTPDETGNFNITLPAAAPDWTASGKFGGGYDFESTNSDYLDTGDKYAYSSVTLSAWVKPESLGSANFGNIFGKYEGANDQFLFRTASSNVWQLAMVDGGAVKYNITGGGPVSLGTWVHIVAVVGASGATLYKNGASIGTPSADTTSINAVNVNLMIGRLNSITTSNFFDGVIDEAKVYNRALDITEVQALYNSGVKYKSSGNWRSASITNTKVINDIKITHTDLDASNYIDKVEIIKASDDSVLYTASDNITSGSSTTLDKDDFGGSLANTNQNFKVKVYLVGNAGATTPVITQIEGNYISEGESGNFSFVAKIDSLNISKVCKL